MVIVTNMMSGFLHYRLHLLGCRPARITQVDLVVFLPAAVNRSAFYPGSDPGQQLCGVSGRAGFRCLSARLGDSGRRGSRSLVRLLCVRLSFQGIPFPGEAFRQMIRVCSLYGNHVSVGNYLLRCTN